MNPFTAQQPRQLLDEFDTASAMVERRSLIPRPVVEQIKPRPAGGDPKSRTPDS